MTEQNISGAVPETFQAASAPGLPPEVRASLDAVPSESEPDELPEAPKPKVPDHIDFGGGMRAELIAPEELTAGDVRPALRAFETEGRFGLADALAPVAIVSWALSDRHGKPLPPPSVDRAVLGKLTPKAYMQVVLAMTAYMPVIMPDSAFEQFSKDLESPTRA
jgi:hypothetical protein